MSDFLDDMIDRAIGEDASDIYIQSESPVFLRTGGRMAAAAGPPEGYEIDEAIERILRVSGARAQLYDREEKDLSYTRQVGSGKDKKTFRFRVNLCMTKKGASIVMRRLKSVETNPLNLGVPGDLLRLVLESPTGGYHLHCRSHRQRQIDNARLPHSISRGNSVPQLCHHRGSH
jgi:Tfp pilus assembly pilus retraction ATPase PilT